MNDDDLQHRFARLRPADPPPGLLRRLDEAEPVLLASRMHRLWQGFWQPWPLAYASVAAVWLLIFALHLATPPAPESVAYSTALPAPFGSQKTLPVVGGISVDRSTLLATNRTSTASLLLP